MTDHGRQDFERFTGPTPAVEDDAPAPAPAARGRPAPTPDNSRTPVGVVLEVSGSGAQIAFDLQRVNDCMKDPDPSVGMAGQVGSQIKIRVGDAWLLASVRDQRKDRRTEGGIIANIDFLGEGSEEKLTGRINGFKRGVTRYPVPGAMTYPATTRDLEQIYASDGRASITIGKVFPTKDIRAGLYIDAMLGKHFALLGSTGTGKSTTAAMILHRICEAAPMRIKGKLDELKADPRYQFMFSGMLVGDTMVDFISKIFRMPGRGKPISIIDVSGVPSDITSTVVAVLSRLVFDFAIWGRDEKPRPILFVCEEAHRYVPNEKNADGSSVAKILSRIAKEGRKYGISLGLITQRPSDLAEGVLSQCGTIISMRLNNERDQAFVKAAMPEGARGFLDSIPALRNRECIICGEGVAIPIRVAIDTLEEHRRPASEDPSFVELWSKDGGEEELVERVVMRWRSQG